MLPVPAQSQHCQGNCPVARTFLSVREIYWLPARTGMSVPPDDYPALNHANNPLIDQQRPIG
jgi:hypothetical protein